MSSDLILLGDVPTHQSSDESEAVDDMGSAGIDGPGGDAPAVIGAPAAPPASKSRSRSTAIAVGFAFLALTSVVGYITSGSDQARFWWTMVMGASLVVVGRMSVAAIANEKVTEDSVPIGGAMFLILPAGAAAVLTTMILFDAMLEGIPAGDAFSIHGRLFWIVVPCILGGVSVFVCALPIYLAVAR